MDYEENEKPRPIVIEWAGEPLPQSRPRFSKGRAYEEARIKQYKQEIAWAGRMAMGAYVPLSCELKAEIYIYRKWSATSRRFGDWDNHAKAILDALNGVCYIDDSQIIEAHIHKVQSKVEGVRVELF